MSDSDRQTGEKTTAFHEAALAWYAEHGRDLPWRRTNDPYAILVAEVMLQQTQVERVEPKYREFLERYPTWAALAGVSLGEVLRRWAPLGYNGRAVRLHRLAHWVVDHGQLPTGEAALRALPGLGPYTAAAVCVFAFGLRAAVIDTNVRRVLARALLGEPYPMPELDRRLRPLALDLVPKARPAEWHHALMDIGATLCVRRRPACERCPLSESCLARPALAESSPPKPARATVPFRGSRRYYRGRFLDALRSVPSGRTAPLAAIGPRIRHDFTAEHVAWIEDLAQRLLRDGLIAYNVGAGVVSLPE